MSSSRSLRPWPRRCTTPHEDRGRPGPEEKSELNYTAKDGKTPPPQPVLFQLYEEEPGGRRLASVAEPPGTQEQVQRHTMEQLADVAPMVPSLAVPVPQMVDQLVAMIKDVDSVVPEQIIAVPKISWPSRFPRTVLREPQKAEQLVEVPVPAPSFSDWFRWEETYRRTRHTWLGGFEWCLTASPGRYINSGPGPRRRPWYRAASVPAHRQSGGVPWLRLSRQLSTVQSVQLWGVRGELQRQVPAVLRRLCLTCDPAERRSWVRGVCSTVDTNSASAWETFGRIYGFLREWVFGS